MAGETEVERLIREILAENPEKRAEVERYLAGDRFRRLAPERQVEALAILKDALTDARRKTLH